MKMTMKYGLKDASKASLYWRANDDTFLGTNALLQSWTLKLTESRVRVKNWFKGEVFLVCIKDGSHNHTFFSCVRQVSISQDWGSNFKMIRILTQKSTSEFLLKNEQAILHKLNVSQLWLLKLMTSHVVQGIWFYMGVYRQLRCECI